MSTRRHAKRLKEIGKYVRPPGRLLDVGAGSGLFLRMAAHLGYEVSGTERAELPCRLALQRYGVAVRLSELSEIKEDGQYDCLTLWGVLEHVLDPCDIVAQAHRLLRDRTGLIGVYTPVVGAFDSLAHAIYRGSRHMCTRLLDRRNSRFHLTVFSPRGLRDMLTRAGFEVVYFKHIAEYNLPIHVYLRLAGVSGEAVREIGARIIRWMLRAGIFFRNNGIVYARKR